MKKAARDFQSGFIHFALILVVLIALGILIFFFVYRNTPIKNKVLSVLFPQASLVPVTMSGLHVSGNTIVNSANTVITMHGVNRSSFEYMCNDASGSNFEGPANQTEVDAMKNWNINSVRLVLNEDCWLGLHSLPISGVTKYRQDVQNYVNLLTSSNIAVLINLHFNGDGSTKAVEQEPMDDRAHGNDFWTSVASTFKNNSSVMFEPYNEPHDISWSCWRDGGCSVKGSNAGDGSFVVAGMQELLNSIRSTGATNIVVVTGNNWGSDISGWIQYKPTDSLTPSQIAVGWHSYGDGLSCQNSSCWNSTIAPIVNSYPLLGTEIGEFDCNHTYIDQVMSFLDSKNQGYYAWAWTPSSCTKEPALITDWNGTPTQTFGQGYKNHLNSFPTLGPISSVAPSITAAPAKVNNVFVILMENTDWSQIKGSSSAPYINSLLSRSDASYATQYYNPPNLHPSEPNYVWLEAGSAMGLTTDNDPSTSNSTASNDHLVTYLSNKGISWKSYQDGISGSSCPLISSGNFAARHEPFVFFRDSTNNESASSVNCISHIRPFSELSSDLSINSVSRYNFITPNLCNDMHDRCSPTNNAILQGDKWLKNNLPAILNSHAYQNNGAVIITWDEGNVADGPIGMIVLSPLAKGNGYSNAIHYTHSSLLRTMQDIFNVGPYIRDAANATNLADLFKSGVITPLTATPAPSVVPTVVPTSTPKTTTTPRSTATPIATINPTPVPVGSAGIRINSAFNSTKIDSSGNTWAADQNYQGGSTINRGSIVISGTSNPFIYQTERYGMSGYSIPMPNGTYTVKLHFAETYWSGLSGLGSACTKGVGGKRIFTVNVEGQTLNNFDICKEVGPLSADIKSFTVSVSDGALTINFTKNIDSPEINGIEVLPASIVAPSPVIKTTPPPTVNTGYAYAVLADNPLAYWRLSETNGALMRDDLNRYTGTYINNPQLGQTGALLNDTNPAVLFNGTSFGSIPYNSNLNTNQFSIEAWVYPTGGKGTYRAVAGNRNYPLGWVLYASDSDHWEFWINSGNQMKVVTGSAIQLNQWTHLTATFDGVNAKLYINGSLVSSGKSTGYSSNDKNAFMIAQPEEDAGYKFVGKIDEVAYFNTVLTVSQIQHHFSLR